MAKNKTFETELKKLQDIVSKLENGTETLEDSLKFFEEGTKIAKFCSEILNSAEQKITNLSKVNLTAENVQEATDDA